MLFCYCLVKIFLSSKLIWTPTFSPKNINLTGHPVPEKKLFDKYQLFGCWIQLEFLKSDEPFSRTFDATAGLSKLISRQLNFSWDN